MIACFSPLPPSHTGVAEHTVDLAARLGRRRKVELFVEDPRSRLALPGWPVRDCRQFQAEKFTSALYHLGNNRLHRFAYDRALRFPGVIVLHDVLQQHMFLGESWDAWEREFVFTYGARGAEIAANLRGAIPAVHEGFFRYPLVKRVVEASRRVIVHSRGAKTRVLREAPNADVRVIPLSFGLPRANPVSRQTARAEFGIPAQAFVLGCFGYVREARLLPAVLRAYREFRWRVPRAEFLQVGEFATPEQEHFLGGQLDALGARRPGRVPDDEMAKWGAACDVVVNLRYPSAGESSAIAVQMMGLGLPVIVTENAESGDFPDDTCLKTPHDELEEALLLEYLLALEANPELARAIGANAREYILREHDPERTVDRYLEALEVGGTAAHSAQGQSSRRWV